MTVDSVGNACLAYYDDRTLVLEQHDMDLREVEKHILIAPTAMKLLTQPEKEVTLSVNMRVSDEHFVQTRAYMVFYNTVRGPAKGGIRFHPDVTLQHTRKLAELMVWKTALVGIPFGGGKSSVAVDPHGLSRCEKTALMKEFVHLIRNELRAGDYIPAPDMGTDASDMATIYGETHLLECVTGKPPRVGGLPGREEATGRGVATVTDLLCRRANRKPENTTVAIQGFGNVGGWAAYFLHKKGFKVAAVSDIEGGAYDPNGLDVVSLQEAVRTGCTVQSANNGQKIDNKELLELPVDILIPAAVGGVLTGENAASVKAGYIVEAANDPTRPEADAVFADRQVTVIPDILANAGGVIASYVEWRKARSGSLTLRQETFQVIDSVIGRAFQEVMQTADDLEVTPRLAAYVRAVDEVIRTMEDRGWL